MAWASKPEKGAGKPASFHLATMQQVLDFGRKLNDEGKHAEALSLWDQVSLEHTDHPMVHFGMATALANLGHDGVAHQILLRALTCNPTEPPLWLQMAAILRRQQDNDAARYCYNEILKVELADEQMLHTFTGLAGTYVNMGEPEKVISWAERALEIDPGFAHARNALALGLLEAGRWREGWESYKLRFALPTYHVRDFGSVPEWDGKSHVGTLSIHAEQGLGDEILFASCIPDVLPFADRVIGECQGRLIELFRRSFPSITWYPTHEDLIEAEGRIDAWYRMGDLPGLFRPQPSACPGVPYLKADPAKVAGYRARLSALGPGPHIGLAWKGGTAATHDKVRNCDRDLWRDLIGKLPGTPISVQYGEGDKLGLTHWSAAIADLDEYAALISALDCVISVCQTAVHFAGALGTRCLVATPSKPAWRYGQSGTRMSWYESVTLVRQVGNDWPAVFKRIAELADQRKLQAA